MRNKKWIVIASALAVLLCGAGVLGMTDKGSIVLHKAFAWVDRVISNYEYVKESDHPIAFGSGSMQTYGSLQSLNENSVLVAEVKIIDQDTVYISQNPPSVETWSEAEIKQVFKGTESRETVTIIEFGGVIDQSKSTGNEMRSDGAPRKTEAIIESALEGSPVMKMGNTYIVFLKRSGTDKYSITGSIQGKIRISDTTNKGVVTIDPEVFAEHMNDLFWFQRKFAGKEKAEIAGELESL